MTLRNQPQAPPSVCLWTSIRSLFAGCGYSTVLGTRHRWRKGHSLSSGAHTLEKPWSMSHNQAKLLRMKNGLSLTGSRSRVPAPCSARRRGPTVLTCLSNIRPLVISQRGEGHPTLFFDCTLWVDKQVLLIGNRGSLL